MPLRVTKRPKLIVPAVLLGLVFLDTKHGIAALVVAGACFVFAWFQSGPSGEVAA